MKPPQRGGEVLGHGGQGIVSTIDELPDAVARCPHVTLVTVDLLDADGRTISTRVDTERVVGRILPFAVFKSDLEPVVASGYRSEAEAEFRSVEQLLRAMAVSGHEGGGGKAAQKQRAQAAVAELQRLCPFIVLGGRYVVVGVVADACLPYDTRSSGDAFAAGSSTATYHPIYRRMAGSLRDISKKQPGGLELGHLLGAVDMMLDGIRLLDRCGVRHGDVKEHNILYDMAHSPACERMAAQLAPGGPDAAAAAGAAAGAGACALTFKMTDFGYLRFPSGRLTSDGTPGSVSPLLFAPNNRETFVSQYLTLQRMREIVSPEAVWASYSAQRERPVPERTLKNDLYAVGIMMACLRVQSGRLPPPLRQLVLGLVLGSGAGAIWTVEAAKQQLAAAEAALRRTSQARGSGAS